MQSLCFPLASQLCFFLHFNVDYVDYDQYTSKYQVEILGCELRPLSWLD
jgi:hypothetical protein